jgi:hypothetical protein
MKIQFRNPARGNYLPDTGKYDTGQARNPLHPDITSVKMELPIKLDLTPKRCIL